MPAAKRVHTPATDAWDDLQLRLRWPEQYDYEVIRPVVLFGLPVADRAEQTGVSPRTIARHADRFDAEGFAGSAETDPVTTGSDVRPIVAGRRRTLASGEADLLHEEAVVVLEVLLDDLAVLPAGDSREHEVEGLAGRLDEGPVRLLERRRERPRERCDGGRVVAVSNSMSYGCLTLLSGNAAQNRSASARWSRPPRVGSFSRPGQ